MAITIIPQKITMPRHTLCCLVPSSCMISKHQDHKFNACKDVAVYHTKEKQKQKNRDESFKNKQNYVAIKTEFLSQYYLEICDASFSLEICIILAI